MSFRLDNEKPTVAMLLDIEHLYGEHEGRLGPIMYVLIALIAPTLVYIYLGATSFMPLWLFIPLAIIVPMRVLMLSVGREKHRVAMYRKQLEEEFTATASLMNIKMLHPDGCIEYVNGKIAYLVCCFNGTSLDDLQRCAQVRKLCESMFGDFEFDIYVHNVVDSPALLDYYNRVQNFDKNIAARNFITMIDHTIDLTENTSVVQCTIYMIKARRSDWTLVRKQIDSAISSSTARCYKKIYRIDDAETINSIIDRDVDGVVDIPMLMRSKYSNQHYGNSKVLAYDLPEDKELIQGQESIVKVINDVAPQTRMHVIYEEEDVVTNESSSKKEHN